jgi:DNA helicase-2/ATP-dependent DNA helicase PcrA
MSDFLEQSADALRQTQVPAGPPDRLVSLTLREIEMGRTPQGDHVPPVQELAMPSSASRPDPLLAGLTDEQRKAVTSGARRLLIIAGAGSGKTEVMARRIAWWVRGGVPKDSVVAFTFTEKAAEEMKFRIRKHVQAVTPPGEDATLGGMYVGTLHGFCLKMLRELAPDDYHNYDVIDDIARTALVQKGAFFILGLKGFQSQLSAVRPQQVGQYDAIEEFLLAYDVLHEFATFDVRLCGDPMPTDVAEEADWCKDAELLTDVGGQPLAKTFAASAARYYAYLRCRRFLDFSTSQSELLRLLKGSKSLLSTIRQKLTHVVVDEVQDINPVQDQVIRLVIGDKGHLTAVGDHRQAIYHWRGGRVDIMARLYEELKKESAANVVELPANFRSTGRVIEVANDWAETIGQVKSMSSPAMTHGRKGRKDYDPSHVAAVEFDQRAEEAEWIARRIAQMVRPATAGTTGVAHDTADGERGISYGDIAVLLRTSTDTREYMRVLQDVHGIPAVVRAGPDLFAQPEVLLFYAALCRTAGVSNFLGSPNRPESLVSRAGAIGAAPDPESLIRAAGDELRRVGLPFDKAAQTRLLQAARLLETVIGGGAVKATDTKGLTDKGLVAWLVRKRATPLRRVFPQTIYHWLLSQAGVGDWQVVQPRGRTALFHLGALSTLVKGIETPGWVDTDSYKYALIALGTWGSKRGRTEEAPLLVQPDAVTISTIHAAKGLEYPVVFLADVRNRRFPSQFAGREPDLPFDGPILKTINPANLADNDNCDGERRLMYVALTRAERYLFVTTSTATKRRKEVSRFFTEVRTLIQANGGRALGPAQAPAGIRLMPTSYATDDDRLVTSFSDIRYFLECPHDFYLRKVLGFAPSIDQAFGYGRGVHNLMRAIHTDPKRWAALAKNPAKLRQELERMVESGLFYLRYTTGSPLENMRAKAVEIIADYVTQYEAELGGFTFEPEREFETLIEEAQVLVSGAIDVIRQETVPPKVTLIDFKTGEAESDVRMKLDEELMRLQVTLYALAAKKELEYEPERGLVRYLGEAQGSSERELEVDLSDQKVQAARKRIVLAAQEIRTRDFEQGPAPKKGEQPNARCGRCDFLRFCGRKEAKDFRAGR